MARAKAKSGPDTFDILEARLEGVHCLLQEMDRAGSEALIRAILRAGRVFVTGKGRSGLIAECFAMRLMQMGFDAHVPGESTCPRIRKGDLMVAISCSGTTMTTVQLARIAREAGANVTAVTAVADSPLGGHASEVLLVPVAGRDVTKRFRYVLGPHNNTLFEEVMLLYFDALVYSMLEREGISKHLLSQRHTNLE